MRVLSLALTAMLVLPVAAHSQSCRGDKAFDLGGGVKGCVVTIEKSAITTTLSRDDGASSSSRRAVQPMAAAVMTGPVPANRGQVKKQMMAMCKFVQADVASTFAGTKYNRIILVMDWREAGGELQSGFSSAKCKGFRFFGTS